MHTMTSMMKMNTKMTMKICKEDHISKTAGLKDDAAAVYSKFAAVTQQTGGYKLCVDGPPYSHADAAENDSA